MKVTKTIQLTHDMFGHPIDTKGNENHIHVIHYVDIYPYFN